MPSFLQKLVTAIFSLIGLALFLGFLWKLLPGKGEKHEAVVAEQFTHHEGTHEEHPEGSTEAPTPRMIPAPNPVPPPKPPDPVVVIDAGHGGIDGGTKGFGQQEKLLTLEIAKELAAELKRRGIPHVMTRTEDKAISLDQRCAFANSAPRLAFVSVHLNWGRPSSVTGIETFYTEEKSVDAQLWTRRHLKIPDGSRMDDGRGAALARMIQDSASTSTGAKNRGVKEYKYAVTRRVRCPSVLIECGFLQSNRVLQHHDASLPAETRQGDRRWAWRNS
ncbi:MAG: N-acetylmuramoyl-L-alanine amidase [Verrucomicrobiales bacterium]